MKRVITVTSGKGGVGKTNICVNLAVQFARQGLRPCIFDADLGLANINILMGIHPEHTLEAVLNGEKRISDIMIHDTCGVDIIPGGTGVEKLAAMTPRDVSQLIQSFSCLEGYDVLFFDTSAGISRDVLSFCMASQEVLLVVTSEPTSLTDGYSMLKVLSLNGYRDPVKVVMNKAKNERFGKAVFDKFNETVKKYLPIEICYAGCLPDDEAVSAAVIRQRPFTLLYPSTRAAAGIEQLAEFLIDNPGAGKSVTTFETFWEKYMEVAGTPLKLPQRKKRNSAKAPPKVQSATTRPPSAQPPGSEGDNALSGQILASLNQLTSVVTDMSAEFKEFRRALAGQDNDNVTPADSESDLGVPQLPPSIPLDFEAYKKKKLNGA
ncbi:MAG TPA: MinD/ParA family protein [Desulfobacter sp.]|nr:MinD/ParA family protein [Desulfobacter sp.]